MEVYELGETGLELMSSCDEEVSIGLNGTRMILHADDVGPLIAGLQEWLENKSWQGGILFPDES
jgi:hypothetical protein